MRFLVRQGLIKRRVQGFLSGVGHDFIKAENTHTEFHDAVVGVLVANVEWIQSGLGVSSGGDS